MSAIVRSEIESKKETAGSGNRDAKPGVRYAWYVLLVLTGMYMFSFVDRQILSLLVPSIKRDLGVSDTQVGLLQGVAFALFYAFMGLPLGRMVDSTNRRNLIAFCIVVWSFFTSLCAVTKSFLSLFLTRIGVGVGEAGLSPAAYSLIADYFPKERMSAAISVYYLGVYFGSSLALLVGGLAVDALEKVPLLTIPMIGTIASWRVTFFIVGAPGLLFALLAFTIREPARRNLLTAFDGSPAKTSFKEAFLQMKRRWKSVAGISIGMIFQVACNYAVLSWIPVYFPRIHGWSAFQAGKSLAFILILFACSGMITGGLLSDRWIKKGAADGPIRVTMISAAGMLLFLAPATLFSDVRWVLAFFAAGMFFISLPMGVSVAALQLIFPNQVRGQVAALFLFVLALGGQTTGPWLPGFLNDHVFHDERMLGISLSLTIGISSLLMLGVFLATLRPYRKDLRMMQKSSG